jgi:sec-independent protein translocase protein TatA
MGLANPVHIAIIVMVLLLVFGAKRLPELGRSLGAGMRGFKESISGEPDRAHVEQLPAPTGVATVPATFSATAAAESVAEPAPLRPLA